MFGRTTPGAWGATKASTSRNNDHNEDSYLLGPLADRTNLMLAAVADGMGGHLAGEVASEMALNALRDRLIRTLHEDSWTHMGEDLRDAAIYANQVVLQAARSRSEWSGMGSTLTAVLVDEFDFAVCHIGDSRAYWYSRDFTELVALTRDHSLAAEAAGEVDSSLAGVLTRALGVEESVEIDHSSGLAKPGDRILLCTDGITGVLGSREICDVIESQAPQVVPDTLVDKAVAGGSEDDATAVVLAW